MLCEEARAWGRFDVQHRRAPSPVARSGVDDESAFAHHRNLHRRPGLFVYRDDSSCRRLSAHRSDGGYGAVRHLRRSPPRVLARPGIGLPRAVGSDTEFCERSADAVAASALSCSARRPLAWRGSMTASAVETCIVAFFAKAPHPGSVRPGLIPALGARGRGTLARTARASRRSTVARAARWVRSRSGCTPGPQDFFEHLASQHGVELRSNRRRRSWPAHVRGVADSLGRASCCDRDRQRLSCSHGRKICVKPLGAVATASDVVLGPVEDGGYHLIGMRNLQAQLFEGIDWGTDRVLRANAPTFARASAALQGVARALGCGSCRTMSLALLADPALKALAADLRASAAAP